MNEPTPYVTITEAAAALGVSRDLIYRAIRSGEGAKFGGDTIGGRSIIRRKPFERYMNGDYPAAAHESDKVG